MVTQKIKVYEVTKVYDANEITWEKRRLIIAKTPAEAAVIRSQICKEEGWTSIIFSYLGEADAPLKI